MDSPHRPLAFNKMEALVQEMQDIENGVPVRSQKLFLTSIPSAFMGYDLIEWLMEHLNIDESVEAVHLANQLCQYGYFFPVSDSKTLVVKDDSSLYRFQIPYYWPWQHRSPDNMEYAIYLAKRTLRNKQRHGLEDYEMEALNSLKKNLASKWDAIIMHAEEQVRLAKDRKKGDKIVADSQERAYWRVHRPPPGYTSLLEPVPVRGRGGTASKKRRSSVELRREVQFLKSCLNRTRMKTSVALESLAQYCEVYLEYDPLLSGAQPCNPWHLQPSEEPAFWQYNNPLVDVPTEKRVKRWALSMEDLVCDQTGLQEFTGYLQKEYNHENIKFWMAVNDLRRSSQSQISKKVKQIYEEFLAAGAPCEINIDGKTMERTMEEMKSPSRFTFDAAAEHVYTLLLKKDCYPRFIRSDHYKSVLGSAIQPSTKKRFFGFGGPVKKKSSTSANPNTTGLQTITTTTAGQGFVCGGVAAANKRRGSDRSLTGSAHELVVSSVKVSHSHSQSNLTEVPYRGDMPSTNPALWSSVDPAFPTTVDEGKSSDNICPWDTSSSASWGERRRLNVQGACSTEDHTCPWDTSFRSSSRKNSAQLDSGSSSSDISLLVANELSDKLKKSCGLPDSRNRRLSSTISQSQMANNSARPSVSSSEDIATTPQKSFDSNIFVSSVECESSQAPETNKLPSTSSRSIDISTCLVGETIEEQVGEGGTSFEGNTNEPGPETSRRKSVTSSISGGKKQSTCKPPSINVSAVSDREESADEAQDAEEEKESTKEVKKDKGKDKSKGKRKDADKTKISEKKSEKDEGSLEKSDSDVCPWEDEESCKVDTPFVKTYATLGYL